MVAWAADEAANNLSHDIYCRSMSFDGTEPVGNQLANSSSAMPVTVDVSDNEYSPTVIWTGGSTLIGWHDDDGTVTNTYFKSLDPFTCLTCEQSFQYTLSLNSGTDYHLEGCSKLSGGGSDSDALLVWENIDTTADPDIVAQQWSSADGNVTNLGGGCGQQAGAGYATCARNGNATFSVRLLSELPDVPAFLIFSRDYSGLPCNTCQLIPDPYTGWISPHTTNGYGTTSFDAAIPSGSALIGVSFYVQWLVSEPVTPGCYLFASDMTDGFRVTIE